MKTQTRLVTFENRETSYDTSYKVATCGPTYTGKFETRNEYVIYKDSKSYIVKDSLRGDSKLYTKFLDAINYLEEELDAKWDNLKSDMPIAAISTKTYGDEKGYPVAYRQWRADSHCNVNHGYNMKFHFEFECCDLDARNWCVDYGSLKSLRNEMDDWFDHKTLVSEDDPKRECFEKLADEGLADLTFVEATGCEGLAKFLWEYLEEIWLPENGYSPRVRLRRVEVRETDCNMAYLTRY